MGLYKFTCPRGGVYEGEAHYAKHGKSLALHFPRGVKKLKSPQGETCELEENPRTRGFLPHNLTECEKAHANIRRRLSRCIKKVEIRCCGHHTKDYASCECNPVAVCRATVKCP